MTSPSDDARNRQARRFQTYQGYANWATWQATLFVGNEAALYRALRDRKPVTPAQAESAVRAYWFDHWSGYANRGAWGRVLYPEIDWSEVSDYVNAD